MKIFRSIKSIVRRFAGKILDLDDTRVPEEQMKFMQHHLNKFNFELNGQDKDEIMELMKKKHLVDVITVSDKNGSLLISTNGTSRTDALTEVAMFNYVQSEMKKPELIMIKGSSWIMLVPHGNKIYSIKAPTNLTHIELKALAKDVENSLDKQKSL